MASSSSTHPNQYLFESRPPGRNISNSSSGSSSSPSYAHHNNNNKQLWPDMPEPFTPEMRDLQARGKDPYSTGSDLGGAGGRGSMQHHGHHGGMRMGGGGGGPRQHHHHHHHQQQQQQPKEPFQKTERRDWAETVLDSPELLLMYAQSSGDTLPATRHKFKKIMCGLDYDDEDDDSSVNGGGGGQYHQQQQHQQQSHFNGAAGWSSSYHGDDGSRGGRR